MHVMGIIYEELFTTGELKSFVFNQDFCKEKGWGNDMWVAFSDDYEKDKGHAPVHFQDESHAQLFESVYEGKAIRRIGVKRFWKEQSRYHYRTTWNCIPIQENYEGYLYTLFLPEYAVPEHMFGCCESSNNIIKDGNRYILYAFLRGVECRDMFLDVVFIIDKHIFRNSRKQNGAYRDFSSLLWQNNVRNIQPDQKTVEVSNRSEDLHVVLNISGGNVTVGNNIQQTVVNHFDSDKFERLAEELKKCQVTKSDIEELKVLIQQGNVDAGKGILSEGIQDWIARVKTSLCQGGMAVTWNILTNIIWQYYL